ncbi:hydrolase [Virgisporangium aliadipatigenens]|uniref:Hydrolase n=1 Tax=Virgisporangium aliadipatigenens TaxID=741659 RepID=A0A8J3YNT9_9ACTN|nr:isochorismatase family protein [Virgisporangium aliadipatigenens]GIJ47280.1 hydrolase [Virgisporangium aliadipatigenens]
MTLTSLDPKTALVVIDLQHGILGRPTQPNAVPDVVARSAALAEAFRGHGLPVVLVRVSARPEEAPPGRIAAAPRGGTRPDNWDVLVDEIRGEGDIVVTKKNWGAFYGTDLDLHLRRRGVTQVVLTGVATCFGVESTARAAHEHGYHVTVAADATADHDADAHRHAVERIFPRLGEVGTTEEIIELLAKTR